MSAVKKFYYRIGFYVGSKVKYGMEMLIMFVFGSYF